MKNESRYKSELVKQGRAFGDYARRIEDQFAVGVPDILYGIEGGPTLLIEAKIIKGSTFGPSPRQYEELRRWAESGHGWEVKTRLSLVLGFDEGYMYIQYYHGSDAGLTRDQCFPSDPGEKFPLFIRRFLK